MSKPGVYIDLDKPRMLRYGFRQLVRLEEMLGVPVTEFDKIKFGVKELGILLLVGLSGEDKSLTLEKIGELIDESPLTYQEIAEKIGEALKVAFGEEKN